MCFCNYKRYKPVTDYRHPVTHTFIVLATRQQMCKNPATINRKEHNDRRVSADSQIDGLVVNQNDGSEDECATRMGIGFSKA